MLITPMREHIYAKVGKLIEKHKGVLLPVMHDVALIVPPGRSGGLVWVSFIVVNGAMIGEENHLGFTNALGGPKMPTDDVLDQRIAHSMSQLYQMRQEQFTRMNINPN